MTVDALAGGGRMIAGLGVSGPQIVEGWYGQPWGKPYWRLRDYIQIMRKIFEREEPVVHEGREISLPVHRRRLDRAGQAAALDHPRRPGAADLDGLGQGGDGAADRRAVRRLAADALRPRPDGRVPARGWRRASPGPGPPAATRAGTTSRSRPRSACKITDDVAGALAAQKPGIALYVGGMGAREVNFHNEHMRRMGYADAAERIQELFLAGRKDEAIAAVPDEYVDERCLVGPAERIRERYVAWADSGITSLGLTTRQPHGARAARRVRPRAPGARRGAERRRLSGADLRSRGAV